MARDRISRRDTFALVGAGAMIASAADAQASVSTGHGRTYVVCHGAWTGGWGWKKMRPLLHRPPQSQLFTPTYTGLGERAHLASPEISLETHVADILGVLETEDLTDVTLIAHSYGGMVGTGVADRARNRIRRLIYIDAFVPESGQSVYAITGQEPPSDWRIPPRPISPDTAAADVAWMKSRMSAQPEKTLSTPLTFAEAGMPPRAYIKCKRAGPNEPFGPIYKKAKARGWPTTEIDSSHSAQVNAPEVLAKLIDEMVLRT
jgi:pimeloyl-ACP methyl ester carboxylesterase